MFPRLLGQSAARLTQQRPQILQANLCSHFNASLNISTRSKTTSSSSDSSSSSFKPRRTTPREYRKTSARPLKPNASLLVDPLNPPSQNHANPFKKEWTLNDGELPDQVREELKQMKRDRTRGGARDSEYLLRYADLLTAKPGTTEEKMLERRLLSEAFESDEEKESFLSEIDDFIEEERAKELKLQGLDELHTEKTDPNQKKENVQDLSHDPRSELPSRAPWSEMVVRMDRVQKVQRGGTMVRYRCLVIGGNLRGVAGFGIGKAAEPKEATEAASRMCKRNIFFIDPYQKSGITHDLVGKHNSCIVRLRSVPENRGLKGHPLIRDILLFFGITACSAKSHGNRNIYNVVYATFKAIMKHRSLEDIARARGKRFLGLDKAKRISLK